MAVVTHGSSLPDSSQKADFYGLIDNATVGSIVDADISNGAAIQDTKLNTISTAGKVNVSALTGTIANANLAQLTASALVSGAALTLLPNIPSGAGLIPSANIGSLLGTWTSKSFGQIYQAATDLLVVSIGGTNSPTMIGYTDSSSSPSTVRQSSASTQQTTCFVMPVKKNDYWEVTTNGTNSAMFIIAIGQ
jgi:hypothetical protein